ncbi:uncharacterized protein LOC118703701 isoform X1 [Pipistrellus kuhlii]|uniref:uncharacterized protein LOC118703701 isoform X1 n=1 Tax=Pipistrellus kuhlii TaxID=59472 RepID=UPI001E273C03|nr:uncharacterized protein LOC118703701 isoform X1 [Pipistrellus kuhlii]
MTEQGPRHMADQLRGGGELRTGDKTESEGGRRNLNKVTFSQQVKEGIKKLEDHFNNTVADIVVAHCEDNQECAPLLPEQQQELRNRIRSKVQEPGSEQKSEPEGSHNESPGDFERMFINAGEGEKRRV